MISHNYGIDGLVYGVSRHFQQYFSYIISWNLINPSSIYTRLVIGTSRTVGSAKKFVRITSGFGGGEFTKSEYEMNICLNLGKNSKV
jgi:hypothetical protein